MSVFESHESNVRSYCRAFPTVFASSRGSYLYSEAGTRYLDFFCAAGSLNYGHNHPAIKETLLEYIANDGVITSLDLHTKAKRSFLVSFVNLILKPRNLNYKVQFTGPTGTNAVEAALKLARKVTGRRNVVCFTNGYHGHSLGSLAVTGNAHYRNASGVSLGNATFLPFDGYCGKDFNTLTYFERLLNDSSSGLDLPAAVIVETIQAEGGVNMASTQWLADLSKLCKQYDMLLVVDDIQVGCGRSGPFFSFEESAIQPDLVILSKSLSGSGLPLSVVLIKPELDVWNPEEHTGTFRGNNLAFITGHAALENFWRDDTLANQTAAKSQKVSEWARALPQSCQSSELQVRGRGLIWAIGCSECPDFANRVSAEAFSNGLIVDTCGGRKAAVKLLPPLTISNDELTRGLEMLQEAITKVLAT